jgi:hypothetical protein
MDWLSLIGGLSNMSGGTSGGGGADFSKGKPPGTPLNQNAMQSVMYGLETPPEGMALIGNQPSPSGTLDLSQLLASSLQQPQQQQKPNPFLNGGFASLIGM